MATAAVSTSYMDDDYARELHIKAPTTAVYAALMCFSAVYLQHHYVIDVLLGLTYAAIMVIVTQTPIS